MFPFALSRFTVNATAALASTCRSKVRPSANRYYSLLAAVPIKGLHRSMIPRVTMKNMQLTSARYRPCVSYNLFHELMLVGRQSNVHTQASDSRVSQEGSGPLDDKETSTPLYKANALASVALNDIFFYYNETCRKIGNERMEKAVGNLSVIEVYAKYTVGCREGAKYGLSLLAGSIGALPERVIQFFAPATLTAEFATRKIIDCTPGKEI